MRRVFFSILAGLAIAAMPAIAQSPQPGGTDYTATSISFPIAPPQQVNVNSVSLTFLDNPGVGTYCYWIVSNFTIGNSAPSGPVCVTNGPNTLVSGIRVSWSNVTGASSYDLLRTSTPATPSGACGCAVATGVTTQTATDTGVNAYTISTFNASSVTVVMTNEAVSAGLSNIAFRVNGSKVFSITSAGGINLSSMVLPGSVSGSTTVQASAVASGTLTLPAATDTLTGKATTDTLTNKTLDTAGAGNVFKINGTQITAVTGTGSAVLATSPSLTTPSVTGNVAADGVIQRTSNTAFSILDNLGISHFFIAGTSPYTNTFVNGNGAGVVFLGSAAKTSVADTTGIITMSGATSGTTAIQPSAIASGTLTLPATTDTLVGKNTSDTFNNKTIDTASSNTIKINGNSLTATAGTAVLTVPNSTDTLVGRATTDTVTNKRVTQRVVSLADATSFTLTADTADMNTQSNSQAIGTLTANAPSGTPTDGQKLIFRIKSTNVQTFAWNAAFRGSTTTPLPTTSTGGGKTDYMGFIWNAADSKWDCVATDSGH